jgi:hypothetical protein
MALHLRQHCQPLECHDLSRRGVFHVASSLSDMNSPTRSFFRVGAQLRMNDGDRFSNMLMTEAKETLRCGA